MTVDGKRGRVLAHKAQQPEGITPEVLGFRLDPLISGFDGWPIPIGDGGFAWVGLQHPRELNWLQKLLLKLRNLFLPGSWPHAEKSKFVLVLDGKLGPQFDLIAEHTVLFSPDGRRFAYEGRREFKWVVVRDGKEGPEFDDVSWPATLQSCAQSLVRTAATAPTPPSGATNG